MLLCVTIPFAVGMKGAYPGINGMIAFTSLFPDNGGVELFIMNSDGTGISQITFFREEAGFRGVASPCWSPDSEKIAFTLDRYQQERIWYISKDGTGLTQVTDSPTYSEMHRSPAWSPDGEKIAFVRRNNTQPFGPDIYVIQVGPVGGGVKLITGAFSPSWSPDGSMIAYRNNTDGNIWVADSSTGAPLFMVTSHTDTAAGSPCWSPDGQRIVYHWNNSIHVININGLGGQQITYPSGFGIEDRNPNWSPDGEKIIFGRESEIGCVWIINPDGSGAYDLTPTMPEAREPDWAIGHEPPVGGEILPNTIITIGSLLIVGISTIAITVGIAYNKKKNI